MKYFILSLFISLASASYAQKIIKVKRASRYSIHVFGDCFEGVIFKKGGKTKLLDMPKFVEFTPTVDEVELTEKFLDQHLDTVKYDNWPEIPSLIHQALSLWKRQYWGYINWKGEQIIFVNCFILHDYEKKDKGWLKKQEGAYDGGARYWRISLNLNTQQLFGYSVNGY
jgi:hypothetical protein